MNYDPNFDQSQLGTPKFSSVSEVGKEKPRHDSECNVCSVYKYHFFFFHVIISIIFPSLQRETDREVGTEKKNKNKPKQQEFISLLEHVEDRRQQTNHTTTILPWARLHRECPSLFLTCVLRVIMQECVWTYCGYLGGNEWLNGTMWFEYSMEENLLSKRKTKIL